MNPQAVQLPTLAKLQRLQIPLFNNTGVAKKIKAVLLLAVLPEEVKAEEVAVTTVKKAEEVTTVKKAIKQDTTEQDMTAILPSAQL